MIFWIDQITTYIRHLIELLHTILEFLKMNSMDEHNRMMHPTSAMLPQPYGMSSVDPNHGAPTPPDQDTRKQDIGEILQQIMNITDQSLDEAQAR